MTNKALNFNLLKPRYGFFTKSINVKNLDIARTEQILKNLNLKTSRLKSPDELNTTLFVPKKVHGNEVCVVTKDTIK